MSSPAAGSGETATVPDTGPSTEMRRFTAGIRVVTASLCTVLLAAGSTPIGTLAMVVLLGYCIWAGCVLWLEATGHVRGSAIWFYWVDVVWAIVAMKLVDSGTTMLIVTLVNPVVVVTIGYGLAAGLLLALVAAAGILFADGNFLVQGLSRGWHEGVPTLLVLALVPMAALLTRPMSVLRKRIALIADLGAQLDPRRGLEPICAELVERLRTGTDADVVALVLPSSQGAPAMIATREDGGFRAKPEVHVHLEGLLANVPACPVSHIRRRWWDPRPRTRLRARLPMPAALPVALGDLAATLDVRSLHVVPLTRYARQHGHFIVGYASRRAKGQDVAALTGAAPELLRIVEQAALVDQLQDEASGHERARIGRDLHDSAIQPYLGLKYAVETVALRIPHDNPARGEVDALAALVNGEIAALRELISGLRTGNDTGDNALVPAVRRQVRRFSLLFGIEIEFDSPPVLNCTRALASGLFHLVNEALNNIRKHTRASWVRIVLGFDDDIARIVVTDNSGTVQGAPAAPFMPISLTERIAEMRGTLTISQPDGINTELVIRVPL